MLRFGRTGRRVRAAHGTRSVTEVTALPVVPLPVVPQELPKTLGTLKTSGHEHRTVKAELRANLRTMLAAGDDPFPGVVGFDETVRPELERALLAGHDMV